MAARDYSNNNPSGLSNNPNDTNRVVAFFHDRDEAYKALSALKEAGFQTSEVGLAVGQDSTGMNTSAETTGKTHEESFWQKVKDFFSGDSGDDYDHDNDFRDATGSMGWNDERYGYYESGISSGGAVVTVTGSRADEARRILENNGGDLRESGFETSGMAERTNRDRSTEERVTNIDRGTADLEGERRIQLRGEMLRTYKDRVQRGEVRLRKDVVTENQTVNVPVTREELVIERTEASGRPEGEIGTGEEIRVPLSEERVRVEKEPIVNEEVRVGKRQVQSNKQVSDQVRHEELRVDKEDNVDAETPNAPRKRKNPAA